MQNPSMAKSAVSASNHSQVRLGSLELGRDEFAILHDPANLGMTWLADVRMRTFISLPAILLSMKRKENLLDFVDGGLRNIKE